jgi:hypothetical protein
MIADPNRHGLIASFRHDIPKTIRSVIYSDFVARFQTIICIPFFCTRRMMSLHADALPDRDGPPPG